MAYQGQITLEFSKYKDNAIVTLGDSIKAKSQGTAGLVAKYFNSIELNLNANATYIMIKAGIRQLAGKDPIRLYLVGHGDWQNQTLGGFDVAQTIDLLQKSDFGTLGARLTTVSLASCDLGRDKGAAAGHRIAWSADSYASKLHLALKEKLGLKPQLHARVYEAAGTTVTLEGKKVPFPQKWAGGEHKKAKSKITYYWNGNTQERKWAYNGGSVADDEFAELKASVFGDD